MPLLQKWQIFLKHITHYNMNIDYQPKKPFQNKLEYDCMMVIVWIIFVNLFHRKQQKTCQRWLPHSRPGQPTRSTCSQVSSKPLANLTLFPQMSHSQPKSCLFSCLDSNAAHCLWGKPSALAATQIQTWLTQRNIFRIVNKCSEHTLYGILRHNMTLKSINKSPRITNSGTNMSKFQF